MRNVPNSEIGYTLIELVITITIIAVIAAIAVPAFSSGADKRLDLAAEEFAAAIRFARSESMRTGNPYGFHSKPDDKLMEVFRMDTATNPPTLVYDVYHPVDKSLYSLDLDLLSLASADSADQVITYPATCDQKNRIYFDATGTPWCSNPTTVMLEGFELTMSLGTAERSIALYGINGRVTVN